MHQPPPPPSPSKNTTSALIGGIVAGTALVMVFCGIGGGAMAWSYVKYQEAKVRRGWNLVPVMVADKDLLAGHQVTLEDLAQRSVPEQFITSSVVKPDSASVVVNQTLRAPVMAGQPMRWSAFDVTGAKPWACSAQELRACARGLPPAQEKTNAEIRRRLKGRK